MNVEKRLRDLEANAQERVQSVPPSREVLEQKRAERDAAWRDLGEVIEAAEEEGRPVIDGSKADHRTGPEHDLLAVVVDPKVRAAAERVFAVGIVRDPEDPRGLSLPPENERVRWLFHRLIWDEKGTPWTGPLAKR